MAKRNAISLSHKDLEHITECAKFSGYELKQVQARLGALVMDALGIDPMKATLAIPIGSYMNPVKQVSVKVFIDTLNLNGALTGQYEQHD